MIVDLEKSGTVHEYNASEALQEWRVFWIIFPGSVHLPIFSDSPVDI